MIVRVSTSVDCLFNLFNFRRLQIQTLQKRTRNESKAIWTPVEYNVSIPLPCLVHIKIYLDLTGETLKLITDYFFVISGTKKWAEGGG